MTLQASGLQLSQDDFERVQRVEKLAAQGAGGVTELLGLLTDTSWAVRRAVVAALAHVGPPAVGPLVEILRSRRDHEGRLAATVDALVGSRGDGVDEQMIAFATPETPAPVLCDFIQVIGRRRIRAAVPHLGALSTHADDNVAVASLEALGRIGGPDTVEPLLVAANSQNFFRSFPALDALGRTGDARAVKPIAARIAEPLYAAEALRALGRTGQAAAVAPLATVLLNGSDLHVRAAATALAELRERHEARHGSGERIVELLRSSLDADAASSRILRAQSGVAISELVSMVHVLGYLGAPVAIAQLVELATGEPPVGVAAQDALRRLGAEATVHVLASLRSGNSTARARLLPLLTESRGGLDDIVACLSDEDPEVRCRACETLSRIGETRGVHAIFILLGDADARVSQAATAAIHALGSIDTKRLTLERARSTDPKVRRAALRIVSYFGYPEALDIVVASAGDDDEQVREAAIHALPNFPHASARAALLAAVDHESPRTRAAAMRSLGQATSDKDVREAATRGAGDSDEWVRYYACQALGRLVVDEAVDVLVARLSDASGQVRVSAIEALAALRAPAAFAALAEAARNDDPDLQRAAISGLGRHKRPETLSILREAVNHRAPATRLAALEALSIITTAEVVPILTYATNDPNTSVRTAAIGCLATRLGSDATRALVERALSPDTRERAIEALAVAGDERVEDLLAMLEASDDEERAALLADLLGRLRRHSAHAALAGALRSSNVRARRAAAAALVDVGTTEARAALERAANTDPDEAVRRICAAAL